MDEVKLIVGVEVHPDGGMKLNGTAAGLRRLSELALEAAELGRIEAPWTVEGRQSKLVIERDAA